MSPTRRRSADLTPPENGTEKRARLEMHRRKSIAVIETGAQGSKTNCRPVSALAAGNKTRLSLNSTKEAKK